MTSMNFRKRLLASGSALQALTILGAGVAATAVAVAPAYAQDYTTGTLVGSVRSEDGSPVTSGTVTIKSNEQGFTRSTTVGSDGSFRVPQLPTGTYSVTVSAPGLQTTTDPSVAVNAGSSATYVFNLPAESSENEIVVSGVAVKTNDFAANTTGLAIDVQQLSSTIPVQKNANALILLAPGTVTGDNGFGNFASISGATVAENVYYVNGLNITDFRNFIAPSVVPFEFYRSFDVKTGGITAEFGRALGGVTNAVTKSGSNDVQGGVIVSWTPRGLNAHSPDTYAAVNSTDSRQTLDTNFYLSGPLIKDKLFVYGLFAPQYTRDADTSITSSARITDRGYTPFMALKVDAIPFDGHRLEFTFFRDYGTDTITYQDYNKVTKQLESGSAGYRTANGGNNFIGTYTGQLTDFFTISGSYGESHKKSFAASVGTQPLVQSLLTKDATTGAQTTTRVRGSNGSNLDIDNTRKFVRADADLYVSLFGDHHFRAGFDKEMLNQDGTNNYSGDGWNYLFRRSSNFATVALNNSSNYIRRRQYINTGSFDTNYTAFYLQDAWTLFDDRLNLQLGIRNDRFENKNIAGDTYYKSGNQWGPRLGATFDVFGDKRTKINAFWGRYFLPIATNTNARLAGAEIYVEQRFSYAPGVDLSNVDAYGNPAGQQYLPNGAPVLGPQRSLNSPCSAGTVNNAFPLCYANLAPGELQDTTSLVSNNLKPSYSDEWIVGISQKLANFTVGLRYINRRLGRTLDDVAVDPAVIKFCQANGITGCENYYSGNQYVLANPGNDISAKPFYNATNTGGGIVDPKGLLNNVVVFSAKDIGVPVPKRNYDAVEFTFDKPWDEKWTLGGSYTYTKLKGNYEGGVTSSINQTDTGLTQDYDFPGLLDGAFGWLPNAREHAFKLYGAYQLTDWFRAGFNAKLESPRRFSCFGNYDSNGNPFNDPTTNNPIGTSYEYLYGAYSYYCSNPLATGLPAYTGTGADGYTTAPKLIPRGTAFKGDWLKQFDVSFALTPPSLPGTTIGLDVFNVFNFKSKLDFNDFGDLNNLGANKYYKYPLSYQAPRSVRLTVAMRFGGKDGVQ